MGKVYLDNHGNLVDSTSGKFVGVNGRNPGESDADYIYRGQQAINQNNQTRYGTSDPSPSVTGTTGIAKTLVSTIPDDYVPLDMATATVIGSVPNPVTQQPVVNPVTQQPITTNPINNQSVNNNPITDQPILTKLGGADYGSIIGIGAAVLLITTVLGLFKKG